jgi:FAD/FMN-containing dehydrogenase
MSAEGQGRLRAAYDDATLERLRALKRRLDPENVWRLDQNVTPAQTGGYLSRA